MKKLHNAKCEYDLKRIQCFPKGISHYSNQLRSVMIFILIIQKSDGSGRKANIRRAEAVDLSVDEVSQEGISRVILTLTSNVWLDFQYVNSFHHKIASINNVNLYQ